MKKLWDRLQKKSNDCQSEIKATAANTGFALGGVMCKLGALFFYSSSVLADSFVLRNRQLLIAANRYTHRVAISNSRIKRIENGKVVFEYKDYRDNKKKEMALSPVEFIRRFMLHILPDGFFKIRYYGILSSRKKRTVIGIVLEILSRTKNRENQSIETKQSFGWVCPKCKEYRMQALKVNIMRAPT